ncbi:5'-deoxynucleotidase [Halospina denitrificans]|uniref:5'-deoxynucleotidase n=1 Tax=Halospina denitrificans TaxID=332522 RepID=A0A4R7K038_9GAMM|nr:5'-deoxynucleotidase [Halospina denitrificans]TDT44171.1 5'-deoxynucleotidase [Halospina denitrificans]
MSRKTSPFFAYIGRLRWIRRWGLMRNAIEEDVATHSWEVSVLAHALASIRRTCFGGEINPDTVAAVALYHDAAEVITGDMPTPVKYYSSVMRNAFADVEDKAQKELLDLLPETLRATFDGYIREEEWEPQTRELVKAADRLAALLKCEAELRAGNTEFEQAASQIRERLESDGLPEVQYFLEVFAPDYGTSLDYLLDRSQD